MGLFGSWLFGRKKSPEQETPNVEGFVISLDEDLVLPLEERFFVYSLSHPSALLVCDSLDTVLYESYNPLSDFYLSRNVSYRVENLSSLGKSPLVGNRIATVPVDSDFGSYSSLRRVLRKKEVCGESCKELSYLIANLKFLYRPKGREVTPVDEELKRVLGMPRRDAFIEPSNHYLYSFRDREE